MGAYSQVHTCCVVTDAAAAAPELALKISDLPCHSAFQRGQVSNMHVSCIRSFSTRGVAFAADNKPYLHVGLFWSHQAACTSS